MWPTDPRPIAQRAGLGPAECVTCGAATLAAVGFTEPHCDPCRRALVELTTADDMLALLASRAGQLSMSHHAAVKRHVRETTFTNPLTVKVRIVEAPSAVGLPVAAWNDKARVPSAARRLATQASAYGRRVKLTSAVAEDFSKPDAPRVIHSLCVRLWTAEGQRFGYAAYVDGRFSSAVLWRGEEGGPRRARGADEFAALALGQTWTPPAPAVVGPCYVCHRQVRWTTAAKPYRHKAEDGQPCWAGREA